MTLPLLAMPEAAESVSIHGGEDEVGVTRRAECLNL